MNAGIHNVADFTSHPASYARLSRLLPFKILGSKPAGGRPEQHNHG